MNNRCNNIYIDGLISIAWHKWEHLTLMEDPVSSFGKFKIFRLNTEQTNVWAWIFFAVLQSTAGGAGGL